jgi:hypothetical protein
MEMKRKAVVLLLVAGLLALTVATAKADWYTATISNVTASTSGLYYFQIDPLPGQTNPPSGLYVLPNDTTGANAMVAAALTAMSTTGKVWVNVFPPGLTIFGLGVLP